MRCPLNDTRAAARLDQPEDRLHRGRLARTRCRRAGTRARPRGPPARSRGAREPRRRRHRRCPPSAGRRVAGGCCAHAELRRRLASRLGAHATPGASVPTRVAPRRPVRWARRLLAVETRRPRYASTTAGSTATSAGGASAIFSPVVHHDHSVRDRHHQRQLVLDQHDRDAALRGSERSARSPRPSRSGSCRPSARPAASSVGCGRQRPRDLGPPPVRVGEVLGVLLLARQQPLPEDRQDLVELRLQPRSSSAGRSAAGPVPAPSPAAGRQWRASGLRRAFSESTPSAARRPQPSVRAKQHVLADGQVREHPLVLIRPRDPKLGDAVWRQPGNRLPCQT